MDGGIFREENPCRGGHQSPGPVHRGRRPGDDFRICRRAFRASGLRCLRGILRAEGKGDFTAYRPDRIPRRRPRRSLQAETGTGHALGEAPEVDLLPVPASERTGRGEKRAGHLCRQGRPPTRRCRGLRRSQTPSARLPQRPGASGNRRVLVRRPALRPCPGNRAFLSCLFVEMRADPELHAPGARRPFRGHLSR